MYILYMDLIFNHSQNVKSKKNNTSSICDIKIYKHNDLLHLLLRFDFFYLRSGLKTELIIDHGMSINFKNGDIHSMFQLTNTSIDEKKTLRTKNNRKKNNFKSILNFIENGVYRGEKGKLFWGIKYEKTKLQLLKVLNEILTPHITNELFKNKEYELKYNVNPLFDLLVDFHLSKKNIKPHDSVYHTIVHEYPKSKWLKVNGNKFLPSVLDSYNIKSKYLISKININSDINFDIKSLSYLCKLFGEGYINYLRKFNWFDLVLENNPKIKKYHSLKNETEKENFVKLINNWNKTPLLYENFINNIYKILSYREFLEKKGLKLKFNSTNVDDMFLLLNKWENLTKNYKKGYYYEYYFDKDFLNYVETDIIVNSGVFEVKILKTEEDFFTEGHIMKNCMSKQFNKGVVFIYVSMKHKNNRINLEFNNGKLTSCYGKANSLVDVKFTEPVNILTDKIKEYTHTTWTKEKKKIEFKNFD
jgi:hypothetical protein